MAETQEQTGKDWKSISLARQDEIRNAIPKSHRLSPTVIEGLQDSRNLISIPETCGILSPRELEITSTPSTTKLLVDIRNRVYTAVEVTMAFCKRASIAHQLTNCLTEILYDSALAQAQELDKHLLATGEPVGLLHGLPISVKDQISIAGTRATSGLVSMVDHIDEKDAYIIEILRKAGAVFYVKTTNPLCMLAMETHSNLFGRTVSPYNINLSPGGSSGGEGALISLRGSLLGVGTGTDIGGSLRAPAAFSNIYTLKASAGRIPVAGMEWWLHPGMETVQCIIGPMAIGVDGLELFYEVKECSPASRIPPWLVEPLLVNKPWDKRVIVNGTILKPLRIGLMLSDGVVTPHPPILRSLKETARVLEEAGHIVIPWVPVDHKGMSELTAATFFQDNAEFARHLVKKSGEELTPLAKFAFDGLQSKPLTVTESWDLTNRRNQYRLSYAKLWNESQIDAIICPAAPTASPLHDTSKSWGYTSVFNLLDYSTAVFPAGKVLDIDGAAALPEGVDLHATYPKNSVEELNQVYSKLWFDKDQNGKVLGPERYKYAPIGLQLVARRYEEEKVLGILRTVVGARKNGGLKPY
ncbi:amidase signature domain-containing protein [Terfezia claveryi]|nr:amidase signature domain-containing protein [Terfezia claveryi]